jgi:hypothetical protein
MRLLILPFFFLFILFTVNAQVTKPCKVVKTGMIQAQVIKLCGDPDECDSLGYDKKTADKFIIIWHYGTPGTDDNQRVEFNGDNVVSVISSGKKYEELLARLVKKEIDSKDLIAEIDRVNTENCK